jgi:anti-sigma regulatory factor (Ser/Thr protein kinase)
MRTRTVDIAKDTEAPTQARRALERFAPELDPEVRDDAKLLVSELITNSVKYGGHGHLSLALEIESPRRLRIEVVDQGDGFTPKPRAEGRVEPGGWGLSIVDALADDWGVHAGSTHVWFTIARD